MAKRPIFTPDFSGFPYVKAVDIEFRWYPGFAKSQLQKSIASLHKAAEGEGIAPILEISGKSTSTLGVSLSAFNLPLKTTNGQTLSVECAYQGSKVFENGGPYQDLYSVSSRTAKTDERLRNSGELIAFDFFGEDFPIEPQTAFYDWLYLTALWQKNPNLAKDELEPFEGFSDIVFNPQRSLNCQARTAALFVSLSKEELLDEQFLNRDCYLERMACDLGCSSDSRNRQTELTAHQLYIWPSTEKFKAS
jgi:hypothetical protein